MVKADRKLTLIPLREALALTIAEFGSPSYSKRWLRQKLAPRRIHWQARVVDGWIRREGISREEALDQICAKLWSSPWADKDIKWEENSAFYPTHQTLAGPMGVSFYGIMVVREDLVKHLPPPKPTAEPTEAETPPPRPKRRRKSRAKEKPPRREPPIYGVIRGIADDKFRGRWKHIKAGVIRKTVGDELERRHVPVPDRYVFERALGRRDRRRK
jgi:hypothetical protein